ncbi:Uncharacterised protein [uncultured archaeon]|nr:Uncharacterised protein [uncultured archaeon]
MVKTLKSRLGRGMILGLALASAVNFAGCDPFGEEPTPTPTSTPVPTPQPTQEPTPVPTPQPTPEPTPIPYETISGRLESNEEHGVLKSGKVELYVNDVLSETDSDGKDFSFSVPYNSNIKLRGEIDEAGVQKSYKRTVNLENVIENKNVTLRAVPYPDFDANGEADNISQFKQHMEETNISKEIGGDGKEKGLRKWDLNKLNKIKIFEHNGSDSFSDEQINMIQSKIKDSNDIEKLVNGKELDNYIEVVYGSPAGYEENCIYVVPKTMEERGITSKTLAGKIIVYNNIKLNPDSTGIENPTISHEFGHAFIAPNGEANTLADEYTIMKPFPNGTAPKIADEKSAKIIYEDTYLAGERLDDILGTD